jgi:N-acetylneuraminate lyase
MNNHLGGILPALITPVHGDGNLNTSALEALLERVYAAGVDGVYLCGSTGEGLVLPASQRRQIVEMAVRNSPAGKHVVVHVGAWSFEESKELAIHAEKAGATSLSSLPPAGVSYPELLEHYRALAALTALPFLAYYFPTASGGSLSLTQLAEICALPGISGLKFTDYDLYSLSLLIHDGNVVFNGRDEVLSAGLLLGASGGIGSIYNIVPAWFVELYAHALRGRWAEVRRMQDRINELVRILLRFPFMPALKKVMTWQGIECGHALRPRIGLTAEQESELRRAMEPLSLA